MCKTSIFLTYNEDPKGEEEDLAGSKGSKKKSNLKAPRSADASSNSSASAGNFVVTGVTVECRVCGVKLGRYSPVPAPCPCGVMVPGPALRLSAVKVPSLVIFMLLLVL